MLAATPWLVAIAAGLWFGAYLASLAIDVIWKRRGRAR